MPISIHLSRGLLTAAGEKEILPLIANTFLEVHGLSGNTFMTPNVVGHLIITPEENCYVGGKAQSLAAIEIKVPSFTFPNDEIKENFIRSVTDIVDQLKAADHPRARTYVNVTYAVDGTWGMGGKAYKNADLINAIQAN